MISLNNGFSEEDLKEFNERCNRLQFIFIH